MIKFMESPFGQVIARNGVLAIILAWALWSNHNMVERLFTLIENNTRALQGVEATLGAYKYGR